MNIDLNIHVLIILVAALAGAAVSAIIIYVIERRRVGRLASSIKAALEGAFEPENVERVNVPVAAEQRTVIPDRYCQRCNEPRGGQRCPLCGSKTITIPPEVLAEEIEAHRPKGSES